MRVLVMILLCAVSFGVSAIAQSQSSPAAGEWEGTIGPNYQLLMHVKQDAAGRLTATFDSLAEDKWGIAIPRMSEQNGALHFESDDANGIFDGTIAGDQISGAWKEHGSSLKVVLHRITAAQAAELVAKTPHAVRVAFVISEQFDMIDFAGPWEVFSDVMTYPNGVMQMPVHTYTVAASKKPISSGDSALVAQYTFADAPQPDIIVVPAQAGSPELLEWLRNQNARHATIMSVCTGARQLAAAGLLDGHPATSHHLRLEDLKKTYPKVQWVGGRRWVQVTDNIYTSGGLTSGIDLALHLVELKLGRKAAQDTVDYLEYRGDAWKNPLLAAQAQK